MKIKNYFKESVYAFGRSIKMFSWGCLLLFRHIFRNYPNPAWFIILIFTIMTAVVKIGHARMERDNASYEAACLMHKLDSIENLR